MEKIKQFERFFTPSFQKAALGFAYSLTRSTFASDDLFQETALKAFEKFHTFDPASSFKAWFFTIMRNHFINDYRKRAKSPTTEFEDFKLENNVTAHDTAQNGLTLDFDESVSDEVRNAILRLSEQERTVFLLKVLFDFKYHEIAALTGIDIGTIKSRISRIKSRLKNSLQELAVNEYGISEPIIK